MNQGANQSIMKQFRQCLQSSNDVNKCMEDAVRKELDARLPKSLDSKSLLDYLTKLLTDALLEAAVNEDQIRRLERTNRGS